MSDNNYALPSYTLSGGVVSSDVWNRLQQMSLYLYEQGICRIALSEWVVYPMMLPIYRLNDSPLIKRDLAFKVIDVKNGEHVANLLNHENIGCIEVINPFGENVFWKFPWFDLDGANNQMDSWEGWEQPKYRISVISGPKPNNQLQDCLHRIAVGQDGRTLNDDKERGKWLVAWRQAVAETNEAFPRCKPERVSDSTTNLSIWMGNHGGWRVSLSVEPIHYGFPSFIPQRVKNS